METRKKSGSWTEKRDPFRLRSQRLDASIGHSSTPGIQLGERLGGELAIQAPETVRKRDAISPYTPPVA